MAERDQQQEAPKLVPIGKVATIAGVTADTVRRWTNQGLLHATRTLGGQRRYDPDEVRRVLREANEPSDDAPNGSEQVPRSA
jgi:hypothetical protein